MAMFEGAVNPTIHGGTFIATSNAGANMNFSNSNDIIDILHARSATAGLLDAAERFDAPKCDEGTRVSMLRGMKNFVKEGGQSSVFWLHGPAGIGKSALAQSLALSLKDEGDHAASFFFSRTAPGRNDGNQLIVTLACQLAINIPAIKPFLAQAVKENPLIFNATNTVKMQSLIIGPINKLHKPSRWNFRWWARRILKRNPPHRYPRFILVDGLDECNDPNVQRDLLLCIAGAVRQLSLPFRFVITSRPESHILATFELDPIFQGPQGVKLSTKNLGDDEDADEQITTFLLKEFSEIRRTHPIRGFLPQPWPLPGQIGQLVSKSSKGFIYPATVIRYIKMVNNRPDECLERILGLSEIPVQDKPYEPLDMLYRHIFESVPDANKDALRGIFHFLVVPSNLKIHTMPRLIEKYFDYKPGHVQHVLRDLLCLVACIDDGPIKVLHASLPDFLLDESRSGPLYIDIGDAHATIAAAFPLALNHNNPSRLPGLRYIAFLEHMMQANTSIILEQRRLVDVDFKSRYMMLSEMLLATDMAFKSATEITIHLECIIFVVAYLLVLLIKNVQHEDIRSQITGIKTYILGTVPFSASLHSVRDKLFPIMIPLLRKWSLSIIHHKCIDYIFTLEVPPSQYEIREEIFELYLLMLAPFFGFAAGEENYSQSIDLQPHAQQSTNYSNCVSYTSLQFLSHNYHVPDLNLLARDLLRLSLAHADYSASLTTLFENLLDPRMASPWSIIDGWSQLEQSVIDYLDRVSSSLGGSSVVSTRPSGG